MQMSFTASCRSGREPEGLLPPPLWNRFSKQMSKRKISCLRPSHPSSSRDGDRAGFVITVQSDGPDLGSRVLVLEDTELDLSLGQKSISPWGKWEHPVEVSTSWYPKNCIYMDSWSWRAEGEIGYRSAPSLGGTLCVVQGIRANGAHGHQPQDP